MPGKRSSSKSHWSLDSWAPDKRNAEPTLEERLAAFERRTPEELARDRERIFAASRPARPLPPGKTLEDVIVGALPDDKTEEEIGEALAELS